MKKGHRANHPISPFFMVRPARFELATYGSAVITPEFPNFFKIFLLSLCGFRTPSQQLRG